MVLVNVEELNFYEVFFDAMNDTYLIVDTQLITIGVYSNYCSWFYERFHLCTIVEHVCPVDTDFALLDFGVVFGVNELELGGLSFSPDEAPLFEVTDIVPMSTFGSNGGDPHDIISLWFCF